MLNMDYAFAQLFGNNIIQLTSTSSYIDEFGNFHIIGEVNNTSTQSQNNIVITAILSDTSTNAIIGNYSAFSSIETLRSGELSPFDIVIQNPQQILGTFDFMEFSTTSLPASTDKPANLVLNGSSSFVDNVGNPHITGNMINQGQFPEQFLNLVATFYDNSSLGVVGTQTFGLNVGSLVNNQMAPFDITITDNKTKSQAAFYSLNFDSAQSSMSPPLNPKFPFAPLGGFIDSGLFLDSPVNNDPGITNTVDNNNNNNDPSSSSSDGSNSGSPSGNDMEVDIDVAKSRINPGSDQTYEVTITDADTGDEISGAIVDGKVKYATGDLDNNGGFDNKVTDNDGKVKHTWQIGGNTREGTLTVIVNVDSSGYDSETGSTTFEVIRNLGNTNTTSSQNNSTTGSESNNSTLANGDRIESDADLDCEDIDETNVPVGDNVNDGGIVCESNEGNNDQTSNDEEEGEATNEPSDTTSEQSDTNNDGASIGQPTETEESSSNDNTNDNED